MKKAEEETGLGGKKKMSVNIGEENFARKTYKGATAGDGIFFPSRLVLLFFLETSHCANRVFRQ
jgi:hypothetical protein